MAQTWKNRHGTWRVRKDAPTVEEALEAARGLTADRRAQCEIAAALMGVTVDYVLKELPSRTFGFQTSMQKLRVCGAQRQREVVVQRLTRRSGLPAKS